MMTSKNKKIIYVTGAGRGIGRVVALKLCREGFLVSGCSRTLSELEETKKLSEGLIRIRQVDVRDRQSLKQWFEAEQNEGVPWGLVTAAGIYGPIGPFTENSWEAWKESIEINLYGTALPCQIFSQNLIRQKRAGRIVLLSGGGATQPLANFTSYCASKAAVVRFGETLAHELKPYNITINSIAPGAIYTSLTEELLRAGPEKVGRQLYEKNLKQKEEGGQSPEKVVNLVTYLMGEQTQNVTGRLIAAVWDSWSTLHTRGPEFEKSDVMTLRRIIPEDTPK